MSLGRSFLYECTDSELFEMMKNGTFRNSLMYKDFSSIEGLNSMSIREILEYIIERTDFYAKLYKIGDYNNICLRIDKLLDISSSLGDLGYDIYDLRDYLSDIIEKDMEIKYTAYTGDSDSVKILSIHKSKGLEYAFCYFADLDHNFNTKELREKFISDLRYGIIAPLQNEGEDDSNSILKVLFTAKFKREEISEKIRLFYVALTRAREKFTILIPQKETTKLSTNRVGTIEEVRRLKFKGLSDFIYGVKDHLPSYFKTIDKNLLGLTKDYLYNKELGEIVIPEDTEDFIVTELHFDTQPTKRKRFSKDLPELLSSEEVRNMEFGTKMHEILEYTDFANYNPNLIEDTFTRKKVEALVHSELLKDVASAKVYHEYEFVYTDKDVNYHGSIDLMLEYPTHIDIIDYKLKNTDDENYKNQLAGYRQYIEKISSKEVHTYLYSIIDEKIFPINQ